MEAIKIAILNLHYDKPEDIDKAHSRDAGLARAFAHFGNKVFIVYPSKQNHIIKSDRLTDSVTFLWVPCSMLGGQVKYKLDFLNQLEVDLVLINADNHMYVPQICKYCANNGIRVFNMVDTLYDETSSRLKRSICNRFAEKNIRCFQDGDTYALNEAVGFQLKKAGVEVRAVLHEGLDTLSIPKVPRTKMQARQILKLPTRKMIIIFDGAIENENHPFRLLELARSIDTEKFHFIIIGTGTLKEYFVDSISKLLSYTYIEKLNDLERAAYYHASDFYVSLSETAEDNLNILKAMYYNVLVLAIKSPAANRIIRDQEDGFLCSMPIKIADRLNHGLEYEWNRQLVTNNAYTKVNAKFSMLSIAESLLGRYSILGKL